MQRKRRFIYKTVGWKQGSRTLSDTSLKVCKCAYFCISTVTRSAFRQSESPVESSGSYPAKNLKNSLSERVQIFI